MTFYSSQIAKITPEMDFSTSNLIEKEVSHLIIGQIVFKLSHMGQFPPSWWPSWISQNAQG